MVEENFFAARTMASSRTGRCLLYSLRVVQWRRNDRCTARELVNRKDGRLPDDADLVVRALTLLDGFAAYPVGAPPHRRTSAGCEVLRLESPPRQLPYAPRATGDMGRASGPTGQGQATAEAVQRAQAATRRSLPGHRTQPDQIGRCRLQPKMQPQRHLARKSDRH